MFEDSEKKEFFARCQQNNFISAELKLLNRLDQLIEVNFKLHKDCNYYASCLSISLKVLNRITMHNRGLTVFSMVQARIYKEAVALLRESSMSIKQINYELGVDDPAYFSRRFKMLVGCSPSEFRKVVGVKIIYAG
ncbi:helix-turn-helix domain-containing protein [Chitinophaga rhizophila]|uniref:Helix-turn-helix domain-containing protein n=1 Tax=Chitinophaga rhizophila TaxID=2866212 RepID=A0ABS7GHS5_9BACT|nr:helix-turn-helix domain-containing protein [Chitinophaga rhizophila]